MPASIATSRGITVTRPLQFRSRQGVVNSYAGTEPLTAQVWRGGGQPVLFSPTMTWDIPAQGRALITFLGTDTANLEPGTYQVLVLINNKPLVDEKGEMLVQLVLGDAPGSDVPLKAYCTVQDMYDFFSDLNEILDPKDQTGFGRQRARARSWTDRVIQNNRKNSTGYMSFGYGSGAVEIYGYAYGTTMYQQTDPVLQGYLDADKLMLTSQIIEMNARMALSYACEGEIGPGDQATQWQMLAAKNRAEAEAIATKLTAQIDTNGDGYAEININCGMASNR